MSADRLREAARVLRKRAGDATPAPWRHGRRFEIKDDCGHLVAETWEQEDAPLIATMHPGVALALADWLDDAAQWESAPHTVNHDAQAHVIADLILGSAL